MNRLAWLEQTTMTTVRLTSPSPDFVKVTVNNFGAILVKLLSKIYRTRRVHDPGCAHVRTHPVSFVNADAEVIARFFLLLALH